MHRTKATEKFIYALTDPRDGGVRYVGITQLANLNIRLSAHCSEAWIRHYGKPFGSGKKKIAWVNELSALGLRPGVKLLERVQADDTEAEYRWVVKMLAEGARLTNGCLPPGSPRQEEIKKSPLERIAEEVAQKVGSP